VAGHKIGRRRMADRDEDAVRRNVGERAGLDVLQPDMGDLGRFLSPQISSMALSRPP